MAAVPKKFGRNELLGLIGHGARFEGAGRLTGPDNGHAERYG